MTQSISIEVEAAQGWEPKAQAPNPWPWIVTLTPGTLGPPTCFYSSRYLRAYNWGQMITRIWDSLKLIQVKNRKSIQY